MQYRISDESYTYTEDPSLFGPGQGSKIGPFLWLLCFCLIADALGWNTPVMHLRSADQVVDIHNLGDAFIDDAYLGTTSTYSQSLDNPLIKSKHKHKESAIINLQQLSQKWERLLFTFGGAINLHKSF